MAGSRGHYRRRYHESPMGVHENRSKSDSRRLMPPLRRFHLLPTKNGPGPGQPKYSGRESGTLASLLRARRDAVLLVRDVSPRRMQTGERRQAGYFSSLYLWTASFFFWTRERTRVAELSRGARARFPNNSRKLFLRDSLLAFVSFLGTRVRCSMNGPAR